MICMIVFLYIIASSIIADMTYLGTGGHGLTDDCIIKLCLSHTS